MQDTRGRRTIPEVPASMARCKAAHSWETIREGLGVARSLERAVELYRNACNVRNGASVWRLSR